ncbi:MAG: DUF805 domain-containing protein [Gammaproteobacteria bacterium]|nr:DUF805 domain-containing protein [Gammaproteobacteria bacterium]
MTDQNPYTTPDASLDIADQEIYEPSIFTFRGRIGRLRYLAYGTGVQLLLLVPFFAFGGLAAATTPGETVSIMATIVLAAYYLASIVFTVMFAKRRLNDLNRTGWWTLLFIIPLANMLLLIYLVFFPGSQGGNNYGSAPSANTLGVKILGLMFPLLFIVGMLAAITIPAYQDYASRAEQSQIQQ